MLLRSTRLTHHRACSAVRHAVRRVCTAADEPAYDYDLFVIGTGSGGMRATKFAKRFDVGKVGTCDMPFDMLSVDGPSITSANTVGGVGGTCVLRGCIPKKYFWYASHFKHLLSDAQGYGWDLDVKGFRWEHLLSKKRAELTKLHTRQLEKHLPNAGVDVLTGRGSLLDGHTIHVGAPANKTVTARTILLATGTTPTAIDIPGVEHCISSDHLLELPELPRRLAVIGAGYIACEFACMFGAWGTDTHVIYRKDLPLAGFDDDCRRAIARQMASVNGVHMRQQTSPTRVEKQPDGRYSVHTRSSVDGSEEVLADCDVVLMATGRHANVEGLGLEKAGVEMSGGRVNVDKHNRTTCESIYAIGDVTDRMQLTPVAIQEAFAFLQHVYGSGSSALDYERIATATFTQPPMGTCGLPEHTAVARYPNVDVYLDGDDGGWHAEYHDFIDAKMELLVKVIVNADDDRVLGIHIVGKDAGEIMQGFGAAMVCGLTKQQLFDTVAIHPTIAEEIVCIPGIDQRPAVRKYRNHELA